jgi:hypothetical protein
MTPIQTRRTRQPLPLSYFYVNFSTQTYSCTQSESLKPFTSHAQRKPRPPLSALTYLSPLLSHTLASMRFALTALFVALLAAFAMAAAPQKSVIMSWPNDTPDSVVEAAKKAIIDAKGTITHEYSKWLVRRAASGP